ncbi:MAG: 1-deoxy-D-xylulose-5-phosphate reductoisomerase [Succinivibrio sp.]
MRKISLLGATGSIGSSTLDVLRRHPSEFKLCAAACGSNDAAMLKIAREFRPDLVAVADKDAASRLEHALRSEGIRTEVLSGSQGVVQCARAPGRGGIACCAIVGSAGLPGALAAVQEGCTVALANKEALVMSGKLFFDEARAHGAKVLPVDSEHSAIFQCLPRECQEAMGFCDLDAAGVEKILLTGSGGPFLRMPLEDLQKVTPAQAVSHPVWSMGPKISTDSATMMNKGLEFIEARYLFNAADSRIRVVIHPQSVIHSMVSFKDGAVLAQIGRPDMRTPIARALFYPGRGQSGVEPFDFTKAPPMEFLEPDFRRYPCLRLAMQASLEGQGATTALNAANEVAVDAFLKGRIPYTGIAAVVSDVLESDRPGRVYSLEEIMEADRGARQLAQRAVEGRAC